MYLRPNAPKEPRSSGLQPVELLCAQCLLKDVLHVRLQV